MKSSKPEEQGISSKSIKRLLERILEQKIPIHSLLIARHGIVITEAYFAPYERETLNRMFSQTKSFTSLAIGLLEAEGKLTL